MIHHTILLKKLETYGVRRLANDWFHSYLSKRRQFVSIGNSVSEYKPFICGVPQGSVLGPMLFLVYINDFNNCRPDIDFHRYADDSNLFCSHKGLQCLETILNDQLCNIDEWLCGNKLFLKTGKSNFVVSTHLERDLHFVLIIKIYGKVIMEKSSNIKYLGVLIDDSLNWKDDIHELSKKISRRHWCFIKALQACFYSYSFTCLSFNCLLVFTYHVLIWGHTYKTSLHPLIVLQKKQCVL